MAFLVKTDMNMCAVYGKRDLMSLCWCCSWKIIINVSMNHSNQPITFM